MNYDDEDIKKIILFKWDNINDNLDDFKKQNLINNSKFFIKNSNNKDILLQLLMGKNNQNKKKGLQIN